MDGNRDRKDSAGGLLARRFAAAVPSGVANLFLALWIAFTLFTIAWVLLSSFKTNQELFESVWSLPKGLNLQSYVKAWKISKMGSYFLNSMLLITFSTAGIVFVAAPAAYVLARVAFRDGSSSRTSSSAGCPSPRCCSSSRSSCFSAACSCWTT